MLSLIDLRRLLLMLITLLMLMPLIRRRCLCCFRRRIFDTPLVAAPLRVARDCSDADMLIFAPLIYALMIRAAFKYGC